MVSQQSRFMNKKQIKDCYLINRREDKKNAFLTKHPPPVTLTQMIQGYPKKP